MVADYWEKDGEESWKLFKGNRWFVGKVTRSTFSDKYFWIETKTPCDAKNLNTTDLEEAKNIAFALWALNQ